MTRLTEKEIRERLDPVCDAFEAALGRGERPMLTDLVLSAAPEIRSPLFTELLAIELEFRTQVGEVPGPAEYESRYPGFTAEIQGMFRKERATEREELRKTSDETGVSPETPSPATDSLMVKTLLADGCDTVDDADDESASGEVEFRKFLQPSMRTGWLGQLVLQRLPHRIGRGTLRHAPLEKWQHPCEVAVEACWCRGGPDEGVPDNEATGNHRFAGQAR